MGKAQLTDAQRSKKLAKILRMGGLKVSRPARSSSISRFKKGNSKVTYSKK